MANPVDTAPLFAMIGAVAPVLVKYTQDNLVDELWNRPGLSLHDRAIVTVTALVSRNSSLAYPYYFNKALESGVKPSEFSELLTHLAFYVGWPYAFGAIAVLKGIFDERGVTVDDLPPITPDLLPLAAAVPDESVRTAFITDAVAPVSAALQHFTDDLLYHEVWRRPGLSPRDRSLASVACLAALGQADFIAFYGNRALLLGVTKEDFGEALAHIAFYAGWGNAIRAAGVLKPMLTGEE